jgi:hypothetical protein
LIIFSYFELTRARHLGSPWVNFRELNLGEGRVTMKGFLVGLVVTLALVLGSNVLTWSTTGLSYDHFTWAAYAAVNFYPGHEDEVPGGCSDGEDNDMDMLVDCADVEDCSDEAICVAPAPTVSPLGLVALMVLLMLIGLYGLMQRRTQKV